MRKQEILSDREFLFSKLGAVFGWTYHKLTRQWSWTLLYWKVVSLPYVNLNDNPYTIRLLLSGLMDWKRGRHLDRRTLYGLH